MENGIDVKHDFVVFGHRIDAPPGTIIKEIAVERRLNLWGITIIVGFPWLPGKRITAVGETLEGAQQLLGGMLDQHFRTQGRRSE